MLFCIAASLSLSGCFLVRQNPPEPRQPEELVADYLRSVFDPSVRRNVYDLLTTTARNAIPYRDFVTLSNGEVSHILGSSSPTDTKIFVSLYDRHDFSDDHCVLYTLLYVRHLYSIGERETYRLVRLHCYREGEVWRIQPFMHAETGTVFFVPTRRRGPLWRISRDMELIAREVADDMRTYEEETSPPVEKTIPSDSEDEPPLVVLDVPREKVDDSGSEPLAADKKVQALLSIGKLCYEAGKVDAAEDTFRRVLALDPNNSVAVDYLSRCENYRLLQKEKEEAVRLMEELLRLESGERSKD